MKYWEEKFLSYFANTQWDQTDASHDLAHFCRVAKTADLIAKEEIQPTDSLVILAAAYFHDIVCLPKNHPECKFSSRYSAEKTKEILKELDFPEEKISSVCHAIHAHSFSAGIIPETLEAKIIQDADRMESLGALGAMRTFYVSGRMNSQPYHPTDLFGKNRELNDKLFALDHFYCKLFKLPDLLQTTGGRKIASNRVNFLKDLVNQLASEVEYGLGWAHQIVEACVYSGKNHLKLFDAKDPFAQHRPINEKIFAIDRLLPFKQEAFISSFLDQLKYEIN